MKAKFLLILGTGLAIFSLAGCATQQKESNEEPHEEVTVTEEETEEPTESMFDIKEDDFPEGVDASGSVLDGTMTYNVDGVDVSASWTLDENGNTVMTYSYDTQALMDSMMEQFEQMN